MKEKDKKKILVADNEENIRTVLIALLEQENYQVTAVANGKEAKEVLENALKSEMDFSAVITDLAMPEMDGMALLHWVQKNIPALPVIMITAFATVDTAVEALKTGAFDYITKPFDSDEMKQVTNKACKTHDLSNQELQTRIGDGSEIEIIGKNKAIQEIYQTIRKVANSLSPVLITGESGTGKGLVAQAIHHLSLRKKNPFIQVNCAAIPSELLESELFGYEKGAFTGAVTSKPGRFELAHRGSLFLDEIGELKPDFQVKLLHAVQHQTFERVGGVSTVQVDVRLITATNRDLAKEIKKGSFREDLFYRLNVIPIHIPPLRKRMDDIPLLIDFFVKQISNKMEKNPPEIHPDTLALLTRYPWPGNIRELQNVLERTLVLKESKIMMPDDLPPEFSKEGEKETSLSPGKLKEALKQHGAALERDLIVRALEKTKGNVTKAAKELGISRKSLQLKMRQYNLRND